MRPLLAARLRRERPPLAATLSIGRQISSALAAAHTKGVIHPTASATTWRSTGCTNASTMYIPFGFTGADGGQPGLRATLYSTDGNWVLAGGLVIDFGTRLRKR
jgi:hypothetical protein